MSDSDAEDGPKRNINCENLHLGDQIHQHQHEHQNQFNVTKNVNVKQFRQQITYVDRRQITVQQANLQIAPSSARRAIHPPPPRSGIEWLPVNRGKDSKNQATHSDHAECPLNAAIIEATQSQKQNLAPDITLHGQLEADVSNVPLVHPTFVRTLFYRGMHPHQTEKFIPSTIRTARTEWEGEIVAFGDLVKLTHKKKFTALIGPAGCGKTTTTKRLVRATNDLVPFHLRFMDMNHKRELTVRQFLMDYLFPDLDAATKESAFLWMLDHPEKCVFIMDGYDQAVWSLENVKPVNASYDTPLTIQQLVANFCCKKFFKQSLLIFTSRPHAMISIPFELRPDVTIDIKDLSTDNMKKLFYAFARERSDELWELLNTKAPQLFDLCHNPILLQFIIIAALYSSADDLSSITTITGVFGSVLEHLRHSDTARGLDINSLWEPLGRMAYKGMKRKSVIFTIEDLKKEGLLDMDVQDLVIIIARQLGFNQRLFDGDKIIFFIHQLLQEKFAAKYISTYMSDSEFKDIVDEVVAGGHWAMVRRFLCGILLGKGFEENKEREDTASMPKSMPQGLVKRTWSKRLRTRFSRRTKHPRENKTSCSNPDRGGQAPIGLKEKRQSEDTPSTSSHIAQGGIQSVDETTSIQQGRSGFFLNKMLKFVKEKAGKRFKDDLADVVIDLLEVPDETFSEFVKAIPDDTVFREDLAESVIRIHAFNRFLLKRDKPVEAINFKRIESDEVITRFLLALEEAKCKVKKLSLNGCERIGEEIEPILPHVERSDEVNLSNCRINHVSKLSDHIRMRTSTLSCLDLRNNPIANMGLQDLALCVCYIQNLCLDGCGITDVRALTEPMLKPQSKTVHLSLAKNKIGNQGLRQLSLFVHKLEWLNVASCGVTDVSDFCKAVNERNTKMRYLSLRGNSMGFDGAISLSRCLGKINSLIITSEFITKEEMHKLMSVNNTKHKSEETIVLDL